MSFDDFDSVYDTPEEKEANYQSRRGLAKQLAADQQRMAAEDAFEDQQREQQKIFTDALAEHGLDQNAFNALVSADPDGTKQTFKEHLKSYVGKVARKRNPKGQFVKAAPHQETGRPQQQPGRRLSAMTEAAKASLVNRKRTADGKYYDGKGMHSSEDIDSAILDVLGDSDIFDM